MLSVGPRPGLSEADNKRERMREGHGCSEHCGKAHFLHSIRGLDAENPTRRQLQICKAKHHMHSYHHHRG